DRRDLPPFPTRRSSDLEAHVDDGCREVAIVDFDTSETNQANKDGVYLTYQQSVDPELVQGDDPNHAVYRCDGVGSSGVANESPRSEEHTSELQSRENLV